MVWITRFVLVAAFVAIVFFAIFTWLADWVVTFVPLEGPPFGEFR